MARKTFDIPGTTRKMIVERDAAGEVLSVTDENGKAARKVKQGDLKIKFDDIETAIIDAPDGTTFVTKHNPTCRWVLIKGKWYYICS